MITINKGNGAILAIILIALGLILLVFFVWRPDMTVPDGADESPSDDIEVPVEDRDDGLTVTDDVRVTSPTRGAHVDSPLTITGEARGTWFFEASFPIRIENLYGEVLARGVAQAEGDWMTTEFVPFTATIEFTVPSREDLRGSVILEKDNPSGLPENAAEVAIPVWF